MTSLKEKISNRSIHNGINKKKFRALLSLNLIFLSALGLSTNAYAQINWTHCADENGTCRFDATKVVRYGEGSNWVQRVFINSVACESSVFGDPAAGTSKSCQITEPQWTTCANKDGICRFAGKKIVRYGANTRWRQGQFTDQVACNSRVFGEPANGAQNICQIASAHVDTTAPTRPRGLAIAAVTCNSAELSWLASSDTEGVMAYDIYHDGEHIVRTEGNILKTSLTLSPGVKWGLYVNAVDDAGNVSQASDTLPIIIPHCQSDSLPPTAPTNLSGIISGTTATLTWNASSDNVNVTAYDVYRDGKKIGATNELTYTESALSPNTSYAYTVTARDAQNVSEVSSAISLTTGTICSTSVCSVEQVTIEQDLPWGLAALPDGSILYGRRDAHEIVRVATGLKTIIGTVPNVENTDGEGGLLGLAVTKDFPAADPWIYIYHNSETDNRIVRIQYKDGSLVLPTYQVLVTGIGRNKYHNGGRLRFGPDGKLYAATGDAQSPDSAQDLNSLNGKILRINVDGTAPSDNPFNNYIWTYGHRNPQGLAFDSNGRLWLQEFGNSVLDETNLIEKGGNYGWPYCEGVLSQSGEGGCATAGLKAPTAIYPVAQASCSGLAIINNILYVACLQGNRVYSAEISNDSLTNVDQLFVGAYGSLRTIEPTINGDGFWMTTSNSGDKDSIAYNSNEKIFKVTLSR
ncbi:MAG: glucose dehydrogenase [Gammaproteobacteria bacterium]|nr:MAG: glucose dehydrogenase [Gammaproteobacteria bacterium]